MRAGEVRIVHSLEEVGRERWDALLSTRSTPFMRYAWLSALEKSGCAAPRSGWTPCHLTLWRGGDAGRRRARVRQGRQRRRLRPRLGPRLLALARPGRLLPQARADRSLHALHRRARAGGAGRGPQRVRGAHRGCREEALREGGLAHLAGALSRRGRRARALRGENGDARLLPVPLAQRGLPVAGRLPRPLQFQAQAHDPARDGGRGGAGRRDPHHPRRRALPRPREVGEARARAAPEHGGQADVGPALAQREVLPARLRADARGDGGGGRLPRGRTDCRRLQRGLGDAALRPLLGHASRSTPSCTSTSATTTPSPSASPAASRCSKEAREASTSTRAAFCPRSPGPLMPSPTRAWTAPCATTWPPRRPPDRRASRASLRDSPIFKAAS